MFTSGFVLGAYVGAIGTGLLFLAVGSMVLWAKRRDWKKTRRVKLAPDLLIQPAEPTSDF